MYCIVRFGDETSLVAAASAAESREVPSTFLRGYARPFVLIGMEISVLFVGLLYISFVVDC